MNKNTALIYFVLLVILNNLKAQSVDWKYETNDNIFKYELPSDKVIVIHGKSNGVKVSNSIRFFPSVTALANNTGEKVWEIKNPIDMMGVSEKEKNRGFVKVKMDYLGKNIDYIRFGHLMIVNPKDGSIIFNPTKEGITNILHSKLFNEGIIATAKINNEWVRLFLSFSSWKVEWTKKNPSKKEIGKKASNLVLNLMTKDSNASKNLSNELSKSHFYNGNYINGNYIVETEKGAIKSFQIESGVENWTYNPKNSLKEYVIAKDETKENIIIYLNTLNSRSDSNIEALDYKTGNILWEKNLDYNVELLKVIDESLSILAVPATNVIGKRFYQIYDKKGQPILKDKGLKAFGNGIKNVFIKGNQLIIISNGNQSASPFKLNSPFGSTTISGNSETKFPELINSINLETKKFVFNKRVKTSDHVKFVKPLKKGLLIIEKNQAYLVDYNTRKKIGKPIKSKTKLIFINKDNNLFITPKKASEIYHINKETGEIKEIANLKKEKLAFVYKLTLVKNHILIEGLDKKDNLVFLKIDFNGSIIYNKNFTTSNYQTSWKMPTINNNLYMFIKTNKNTNGIGLFDINTGKLKETFTYNIDINGKSKENIGSYYVSKKNQIICIVPKVKVKSPFDKKSKKYNSRGIIIGKRF